MVDAEQAGASAPVNVHQVARSYGATKALAGVSVRVERGEMFGVIGPDGAGKTTLLRMVCGLIAPDSGHVRVFGSDPFRVRGSATASVGYLSQRFSLYGDLSIDENVEFFARLHGVRDYEARRTRLLALTGLERFRGRLADRLSGGMKQKLALACTLVHEPSLLVLDEPTTGVDPVSRREFWKLLAEFLAQGLTILLATPYLDEAERCSRVALLNEGRVLALEEPGRLRQQLPGVMLEIVTVEARRAMDVLSEVLGRDRVQLFGDRLHARADHADAAVRAASRLTQAGIADAVVRTVTPGLEDVFIDLLGRSTAAPSANGAGAPASLEGTT